MTDAVETTDAEETEAPEAPATPDLSEQFADLSAKLDKALAPAEEPAPDPAAAFLDFDLETDDDDFEDEDDDEPAPQGVDPDRFEAVESYLIEQEMEKRTKALQALPQKYEDFTETIPQIKQVLDDMGIKDTVQRGNAKLIERIYLSLKAEADADAETPAEEAARRGARLETGATGTTPGAEDDPDADFKRELRKLVKEDDDIF